MENLSNEEKLFITNGLVSEIRLLEKKKEDVFKFLLHSEDAEIEHCMFTIKLYISQIKLIKDLIQKLDLKDFLIKDRCGVPTY